MPEERERWTSRIAVRTRSETCDDPNSHEPHTQFYFAAIGAAVGFGNVWRFPALAADYGTFTKVEDFGPKLSRNDTRRWRSLFCSLPHGPLSDWNSFAHPGD